MCEALSLDLYREDNYSVMCLFQGVEDPLLELKTPTLFIIGSHSTLTSQEDLAFAPIDQQSRNPHLQSRKISLI